MLIYAYFVLADDLPSPTSTSMSLKFDFDSVSVADARTEHVTSSAPHNADYLNGVHVDLTELQIKEHTNVKQLQSGSNLFSNWKITHKCFYNKSLGLSLALVRLSHREPHLG